MVTSDGDYTGSFVNIGDNERAYHIGHTNIQGSSKLPVEFKVCSGGGINAFLIKFKELSRTLA